MINKFSIFKGVKSFSPGIFQNYLVLILAKKCIKYFSGTTPIDSRKPNRILAEKIENIIKSDRNFAPNFIDHHLLAEKAFNGHCLIKISIFVPRKAINLYISYTLTPWLKNLNTEFTLNNCLFGSVKLTKNTNPVKYKNSGCGIGFDSCSGFSLSMGESVIFWN